MELICPAGTPAAFRDAVDAGADTVYCGFRDETNARNFPGLNFSPHELGEAIAYARMRNVATFVAINTFMRAGEEALWYSAVDTAVELGATALILADLGLMAYAAQKHPDQRLHLSVQASAANAPSINYLVETFGIRRAVLPRVLTLDEIADLTAAVACQTEVFVFGGLCVMAEGRCSLSSYVTGKSPNMQGVCSPASHVRYRHDDSELVCELGSFTINRFRAGENAGYPTLCKGRFQAADERGYLFEDPVSLNALIHLEDLRSAGVSALKIEGRQRGRAYIAEVVRTLKGALAAAPDQRKTHVARLEALSEGRRTTTGAYEKRWR